ncbi:hypothetical protein LOY46_16510 [Pseudomonas sichuanensis]|uniref:hypothetical protein n=1 Tax=Pseudomonas sichuanensis TaxID=2213015 RepID=UPI002160456C|nr:hypothetical protein [Pseudomonas sichuanensis]UVK81173.1 hypothetical protein LOY46_16510 [Pseudomonas sichuanensis]
MSVFKSCRAIRGSGLSLLLILSLVCIEDSWANAVSARSEVLAKSVVADNALIEAEAQKRYAQVKVERDLAAYKELAQVKLDALKDGVQKDIQTLTVRMDAQDKIIATQGNVVDKGLNILGISLSMLGLILTLAGVVGFLSVRRKAQNEARSAAAQWLDSNSDLQAEIKSIRERLQELESQARRNIDSLLKDADDAVKKMQRSFERVKEKKQGNPDTVPENEAQALARMAKAVTEKPESAYSYNDWNTRAFDAYLKGELTKAAQFWRAAADHEEATPLNIVTSLSNMASMFDALNHAREEIAVYDEIIERFGSDHNAEVRRHVAKALGDKGVAIVENKLGDPSESYSECIRRYDGTEESSLKLEALRARYNRGVWWGVSGKREDALADYDEVIRQCQLEHGKDFKVFLAKTLLNKGHELQDLDAERALAVWRDIVDRFADEEGGELKAQVAKALLNTGILSKKLGDARKCESLCGLIIERYFDEEYPDIKRQVAGALVVLSNIRGEAGRYDEADECMDQLIGLCGQDPSATLKEFVYKGKNGKAYIHLCRAKQDWLNTQTRTAELGMAELLITEAISLEPSYAILLGNQAYCGHLQGQPLEVTRQRLSRAIQLGGEALYQGTLSDLEVFPVGQCDDDFRTLLEEIWSVHAKSLI